MTSQRPLHLARLSGRRRLREHIVLGVTGLALLFALTITFGLIAG